MKRSILNLAAILLLVAGSFSCMISCKKEHPVENPDQVCGVDNPLTDLEWLRQRVADLASSTTHARITQCTYETNKIGFLIEPCVGCLNIMCEFVNCDGIVLCIF